MSHHEYWYTARVVDVYDGDSVTLDVDLGFHMTLHGAKMRLIGIDTPELRGEERPQGLVVRDWLRELVLGQTVLIQTEKDATEKYGRWLCVLYARLDDQWVNVNQLLLDQGMARPYLG